MKFHVTLNGVKIKAQRWAGRQSFKRIAGSQVRACALNNCCFASCAAFGVSQPIIQHFATAGLGAYKSVIFPSLPYDPS